MHRRAPSSSEFIRNLALIRTSRLLGPSLLASGLAISACSPAEDESDPSSGLEANTGGSDASGGTPSGSGATGGSLSGNTGGSSTGVGGAGSGGIDAGVGGTGVVTPVDCSGITAAGYELCTSSDTTCEAVFTNSAGCDAVCAAAGLACAGAMENIDGQCAADTTLPGLACNSGHGSDYCLCSGSGGGTGGASGTGGAAATGGASSGGTSSGGTSSGGTSSGGTSSGGTSSGGTSSGGTSSGGTSSGGTGGSGGMDGSGPDQCKPIGWATRAGRTGGPASVTGGGNAAPIVVSNFSDLAKYAADGTPRVIHIDGTVGSGWSGKSGDRLEIKSNKTIIGIRPQTLLKAAIHIQDASNVILRNVVIRGPGSNGDQAWDNINIEGSSKNIWVDHAEFWDGQDGNADVVKGADNVTFTWSIFGYTKNGGHNLSNLIASSDNEPVSEGKLNVTFMFNWWKAAAQRQPRCRYGYIHVVNNLYTEDESVGPSQLGVTNGYSCNVLTENNHFVGQNEPIDLGKQAGSGSVQEAVGNLFESCSGNQKGSGKAFTPPYEYKSFMVPAADVKALVQKYAGATLASPTSCSEP